nr:transposase, MuDR [Tanacetum cinerariifolium]
AFIAFIRDANWDKYVDSYYTIKKFKEAYALEIAPYPIRMNGWTYNQERKYTLLLSNVLLEDQERIELLQLTNIQKENTSVRNVVGIDIIQKHKQRLCSSNSVLSVAAVVGPSGVDNVVPVDANVVSYPPTSHSFPMSQNVDANILSNTGTSQPGPTLEGCRTTSVVERVTRNVNSRSRARRDRTRQNSMNIVNELNRHLPESGLMNTPTDARPRYNRCCRTGRVALHSNAHQVSQASNSPEKNMLKSVNIKLGNVRDGGPGGGGGKGSNEVRWSWWRWWLRRGVEVVVVWQRGWGSVEVIITADEPRWGSRSAKYRRLPGRLVAEDTLKGKARQGYFPGRLSRETWRGPHSFSQSYKCHGG